MAILTGEDGHIFDKLYSLRGEVPPKRYQGLHKNTGPQYFRGIIEGNGDPPGEFMWIAYSVNKEDIWIARVQVPVTAKCGSAPQSGFSECYGCTGSGSLESLQTQWAPVTIVAERQSPNKVLR